MRKHSYEKLRSLVEEHGPVVAGAMAGVGNATIRRAMRRLDKKKTYTTSASGPGLTGRSVALPHDHEAVIAGATLFPKSVRDAGAERILKPGENNGKIGSVIHRGAWRGFPIYSVSLEERATCPASCFHWRTCYGNNMPFARRFRPGPEFERHVAGEVWDLAALHPGGFAVRLHSLGDFYSVGYVELWELLLAECAPLHVFGYTARKDFGADPIADALRKIITEQWDRFAIRFSDGPAGDPSTVSLRAPEDKPKDSFICPAQWVPGGKLTESCATCSLCWSTKKQVAFLQHGRHKKRRWLEPLA